MAPAPAALVASLSCSGESAKLNISPSRPAQQRHRPALIRFVEPRMAPPRSMQPTLGRAMRAERAVRGFQLIG